MEAENWAEKAERILSGESVENLPIDLEAAREDFRHVYWIGGSGCAGKSTVTEILAERYGLATYHQDDT